MSSARNFALDTLSKENIKPEFLCFVDSDDIITPNFLEDFVLALQDKELDYVVCGHKLFDKKGIIVRKLPIIKPTILDSDDIINHYFGTGKFICGKHYSNKRHDSSYFSGLCNKCFRYAILCNNRFNTKLRFAEDQAFMLSFIENLKKGAVINSESYLYRMRKSSACHDTQTYFKRNETDEEILRLSLRHATRISLKEALISSLFIRSYDSFKNYAIAKNKIKAKEKFEYIKILYSQNKNLADINYRRKINRFKYGFLFNYLYIQVRTKKRTKSFAFNNINNNLFE